MLREYRFSAEENTSDHKFCAERDEDMDPYTKNAVSVSELNQLVKFIFDENEFLSDIFVRGEISNFVNHRTGHFYFSLKDETSAIKAVMFRSSAVRLPFVPENGMKVIVHGRVSVFERDGVYQLYADDIQPDGIGSLFFAYEQLRRKLEAEGLFSDSHKKPLPSLPSRIGIITSPTGAAIHDMMNIIGRRFPICEMLLYPALVQGERAAASLASGIRYFDNEKNVDLIIIGRGGGSIEDLWAFNDERLARVIFDCEIPVISAVGHESDFTICDFVADVRASTPSAAAELAVPESAEVKRALSAAEKRLSLLLGAFISEKRRKLDARASSAALKSPLHYLETKRLISAQYLDRLDAAIRHIKTEKEAYYKEKTAALAALSPLAVLSRGYGVSYSEDGKVLKSVNDISVGETVRSELADGEFYSTVTKKKSKRQTEKISAD